MTAADLLRGAPLLPETMAPEVTGSGAVHGALHVLDLDAAVSVDDLPALRRVLASRQALVVGVARRRPSDAAQLLADALDLSLVPAGCATRPSLIAVSRPEGALRQLSAQASAVPRAVLVLGALLRQTSVLPVAEGLQAEASAYSTLLTGPEHQRWLAARGPARPLQSDPHRVRLVREGHRLQVRLARAGRRNAFDAAMREALVDALDVALADPRVTVELTGEGSSFSSGGDLDEFGSAADPATAWVVRVARSPGRSLALLGPRARAHVHGECVGAGVELPAFAAHVTADPGTRFRLPEVAMGLVPGAGGSVSVTARIGRWRTAWLALSGEALDAATAQDWGLVDALEVRSA